MKLFEPQELDTETRAIIDAARGGHEPNELSRARVRRGVELKLAATGLGLLVGSSTSALAGAVKATIAIVAVGTAVGTGVYMYPRPEAGPPARRAAVSHPRAAAEPAIIPDLPVEPPRIVERHRRRAPAAPPRTDSAARLSAETALLGAANGALARHDVQRALVLLDEYDRQIGTGAAGLLSEERTATGILALCAAERLEAAKAEAHRFRSRWPRSPLAARVEGSCAGSEGTSRSPAVR
jgi:hypothetical protein